MLSSGSQRQRRAPRKDEELIRALGPGECIALQEVAAQFTQHVGMLHGLDAFRHRLDAERAADFDDRADQRLLLVRAEDRSDELAVDLQPLRLDLEQADDRGVAGAEIVDLDIDAEFLDALDIGGDDIVALVEEDRFRPARRKAGRARNSGPSAS